MTYFKEEEGLDAEDCGRLCLSRGRSACDGIEYNRYEISRGPQPLLVVYNTIGEAG